MKIKEYIQQLIKEELEQFSSKDQLNKIISIKDVKRIDLQGGFYDGIKYTIYNKPMWLLKAASDYVFLKPDSNLDIKKNDIVILNFDEGKNYGSVWTVKGIFTDLETVKHKTRDFGKRNYMDMIISKPTKKEVDKKETTEEPISKNIEVDKKEMIKEPEKDNNSDTNIEKEKES